MVTKIVTVAEMQAIEKAADDNGLSYDSMMQLAGFAVAHHILEALDAGDSEEPEILILVGPGNNGGDGLVAGTSIKSLIPRAKVVAYLLKARSNDDVFDAAEAAGVEIVSASKDSKADYAELRDLTVSCDVLVDALFGTGTHLPIEGNAAALLQAVHESLATLADFDPHPVITYPALPDAPHIDLPYIIAVDCPSGLNCDTGAVDELTLHADATVTFGAVKWGLIKFPGAEYVGDLLIGHIGLEDMTLNALQSITANFADGVSVAQYLPDRPINSYKGTFGKVLVLAGSANYIGAPYLCASAAYRAGAGWVSIGAPQSIVPILASMIPEATWLLLPHELGVLHENAIEIIRKELPKYNTLIIGPGLSTEDAARRFMKKLFTVEKSEKTPVRNLGFLREREASADDESDDQHIFPRMVVDADGLNLLSEMDEWWSLLPEGSIVTPHPGEFVRLAKLEDTDEQSAIEQVEQDRIDLAREYAAKWGIVVVLKGAFTVVANPEGVVTVMPFATAALATAGSGDVMGGTIAGFLAQGLDSYEAAITGAWLAGCAGLLAAESLGTTASVLSGDLITFLPEAWSMVEALKRQSNRFKHS